MESSISQGIIQGSQVRYRGGETTTEQRGATQQALGHYVNPEDAKKQIVSMGSSSSSSTPTTSCCERVAQVAIGIISLGSAAGQSGLNESEPTGQPSQIPGSATNQSSPINEDTSTMPIVTQAPTAMGEVTTMFEDIVTTFEDIVSTGVANLTGTETETTPGPEVAEGLSTGGKVAVGLVVTGVIVAAGAAGAAGIKYACDKFTNSEPTTGDDVRADANDDVRAGAYDNVCAYANDDVRADANDDVRAGAYDNVCAGANIEMEGVKVI